MSQVRSTGASSVENEGSDNRLDELWEKTQTEQNTQPLGKVVVPQMEEVTQERAVEDLG